VRVVSGLAGTFLLAALNACTPQQMLASAVIPNGTLSTMLGNTQSVADHNRKRIAALEQQKDWAGLAAFAEANIARDLFSAEWRMVAGYARQQQGDHPAAQQHYGEMIRLSPDEIAAYQLMAASLRAEGRTDRAAAVLERGLLAVREAPEAHRLLGDIYLEQKRYRQAVVAYREALKGLPGHAGAWYGLGVAAARTGDTRMLEDALNALSKIAPGRAAELRAAVAKR
jgi:tetratricopeptide (TPR) repeat protein